jgi:hypothetical protein
VKTKIKTGMQKSIPSPETTYKEENSMPKAGMRRPDPEAPHGTEARQRNQFEKNEEAPVPEINGKAKTGKKKAGLVKGPK